MASGWIPDRPNERSTTSLGKRCRSTSRGKKASRSRKTMGDPKESEETSSKWQEIDWSSLEELSDEDEDEDDDDSIIHKATRPTVFHKMPKAIVLSDDPSSIENQDPSLGSLTCTDLNSLEEFNTTITTHAKVVCLFYYQINWKAGPTSLERTYWIYTERIKMELSILARQFPEICFVKIAAQKVPDWFGELIYTKFPTIALIENGTPKHFLSRAEIFGLPYAFNTAKIKRLFHQHGMITAAPSAPFLVGL